MKLSKPLAGIALALCALPMVASAGDTGTLYTQLGSNGWGLGYTASVSDNWALRGQYNMFKQTYSGNVGDLGPNARLTLDIDWNSFQTLADWYPTSGGFRLSGGVVFNNNKITVAGTGATVGTATNQTVSAEIKMSENPSPYVGLGYSSRPKFAKGFGFIADVGILFQDPKVTLTASGASASDIAIQRAKMEDGIKDLRNMPVLMLGASYSF